MDTCGVFEGAGLIVISRKSGFRLAQARSPLESTVFNEAKSENKWVGAALVGEEQAEQVEALDGKSARGEEEGGGLGRGVAGGEEDA